MIFRPRQKKLTSHKADYYRKNVLVQLDNTKFLRVFINQHLTYKTYVNFIAAKFYICRATL